ncbi:MAG: hypothetical protein ACT4PL_03180 [Phycisphaerales bacterium]
MGKGALAVAKVEQEYGESFQQGAPRPLTQGAGKGEMLVVYEVDQNNVSTVRYVMLEVSKTGNTVPPCMEALPETGDGEVQMKIVPPPPWWRYTRGRWTNQRTQRLDIVAAGTTVVQFCCNVTDDGTGAVYESEFVVVVGDAGKGKDSKILVTALEDKSVTHELTAPSLTDTQNATIDAHVEEIQFVRTDKNRKLTMPALLNTHIRDEKKALRDAVACVMKHVRDVRKMELHLSGADSAGS